MRERNRMSRAEAMAVQQEVADYTPKQWERKIAALLNEAQAAGTIDGWWRDKDRATSADNRRRMPGKLDFEVWLTITGFNDVANELRTALPHWKWDGIWAATCKAVDVSFTIDLEAKTGRGKPNAAQLATIQRSERNPGRHALVVYPHDLPWLRKVLGL